MGVNMNKRTVGFNTFTEMIDYIEKNKIKASGYGWSKENKHFFEATEQ